MANHDKASLIENCTASFEKAKRFFEIDLLIKLFGVTIFHFHYPPQSSSDE